MKKICVLVATAGLLSACSGGGTTSDLGAAAGASATVSSARPTTAVASSPIDGTWLSPTFTIAHQHTMVPKRYWHGVFVVNGQARHTERYQLQLRDGRFTQLASDDGGAWGIGSAGAFSIHGHLLQYVDEYGSATYRWQVSAKQLRLTLIRLTPHATDGVPDQVYIRLIVASPFTKAS